MEVAPLGTSFSVTSDDERSGVLSTHPGRVSIESTSSPANKELRGPFLWAANVTDDGRAKIDINTSGP